MIKRATSLGIAATLLGGCGIQLSPTQLVGDQSSDVAVLEFLYSGKVLAYAYGLDLSFAPLPTPSARPELEALGISYRTAIPYSFKLNPIGTTGVGIQSIDILTGRPPNEVDRYAARNYFIRAGFYASQIICRNYLSGLRDRNEYFEFLQQEFKVATNLTSMLLVLTNVSEKPKDIFNQVVGAANLGADAYQSFRFLTPEIETVLPLVESAQVAMRDYFTSDNGVPLTFAGALNAVSKIEYQCTRSGIRAILNKTLVQSKPQFTVSKGILYAHPATDESDAPPDASRNPPDSKKVGR